MYVRLPNVGVIISGQAPAVETESPWDYAQACCPLTPQPSCPLTPQQSCPLTPQACYHLTPQACCPYSLHHKHATFDWWCKKQGNKVFDSNRWCKKQGNKVFDSNLQLTVLNFAHKEAYLQILGLFVIRSCKLLYAHINWWEEYRPRAIFLHACIDDVQVVAKSWYTNGFHISQSILMLRIYACMSNACTPVAWAHMSDVRIITHVHSCDACTDVLHHHAQWDPNTNASFSHMHKQSHALLHYWSEKATFLFHNLAEDFAVLRH